MIDTFAKRFISMKAIKSPNLKNAPASSLCVVDADLPIQRLSD
jgi:hypothetical protein